MANDLMAAPEDDPNKKKALSGQTFNPDATTNLMAPPDAAKVGAPANPAASTNIGGDIGAPRDLMNNSAAPVAPSAPAAPITTAGDTTGTASQGNTIAGSFRDALVSRLNPGAVNTSNPAIAPAIQANNLAEQRGFERNRNLLAEQAAKSGTDGSGGFNSSLLGLSQERGQREGQFAGNAVQHLQDQQDADLMSALGLSNSTLQANASRDQQGSQFGQTLAEQARQADQAAALQRLGITTQGALGQGDLALRGRLGDMQGLLGLLGLQQNGDQFTRQLNQQGSQFGAGLDQQGLLGLLGMLGG